MGTYYPICMFPTNSERLIGISDAFSALVYGYPSSCPRAHCTPNKSVITLRYTRRHGPVYIYIQAMPVDTYRVQSPGFPTEDRLLITSENHPKNKNKNKKQNKQQQKQTENKIGNQPTNQHSIQLITNKNHSKNKKQKMILSVQDVRNGT